MKKLFTLTLFSLWFIFCSAQHSRIKCSPQTRLLIDKIKNHDGVFNLPKSAVVHTLNNKTYLSGLIKVNNNFFESQLNLFGILIGAKAGVILSVQIPIEQLNSLINLSSIDYLELDAPAYPTLDNARIDTRVDSVHSGLGLPMPYNGEGVVVGIVDVGFDFAHPTFFDTAGVNYRIKKVWMQKDQSGTNPSNFPYGTELTDSIQLWNHGTDNGTQTHGTHVAGIAAGSGFGSPTAGRKFKGIGYKSDIVLVGMTPDKSQWINTGISDMINGISYVYDYAASVSKPAVVNLSWGSPLGPHDGTSLFSQALDALTGPGKIFVCSAGNNGGDSIHLQKTFSSMDTVVQTYLNVATSPEGKKTWLDVWGETGQQFCFELSLKNNSIIATTGQICLDDSVHTLMLNGSNNDTLFVSIVTNSFEFNGKPRIFIDLESKVNDTIQLKISGTSGTVHMWNSFVSNSTGYYGAFRSYNDSAAVIGDHELSISDISSTNSAISVGAYASKVQWTNVSSQTYSYASYVAKGNLVPFSSHGPTVDGRIKPDIAGPGLTVGSSISSYDSSFMSTGPNYLFVINKLTFATTGRDYPYGMLSGTSMSSPAVAGITSLLLQMKNDLTPQQVRDLYIQTAIKDSWTGVLPVGGTNTWGNGKVNAIGAMKALALLITNISTISNLELSLTIYPNPTAGNISLEYLGTKSEYLHISIVDFIGRTIESCEWKTSEGINSRELSLIGKPAGVYYVKIKSTLGTSVSKVMKQ